MYKKQEYAYNTITNRSNKKNIFLTGPAGTGKSYLISQLKIWSEATNNITHITAMTGSAAFLIKGITLHSWAGIQPNAKNPEEIAKKILSIFPIKMKWWKTKMLIINEVSMLSAELFNMLNSIAKLVRGNSRPFGGIQLVLIGDFFQLPPISKNNENINYCFKSDAWKECIDEVIILDEIVRQNDILFKTCLNCIRYGYCFEEIRKLMKKCKKTEFNDKDILPTKLYTKRIDVDTINNKYFNELAKNNEIITFNSTYSYNSAKSGKIKKEDLEKNLDRFDRDAQYNVELKLCKGAQVMLIINENVELGLINGARGVVEDFEEGLPIVRFASGIRHTIRQHSWDFEISDKYNIKRIQLPLVLAWALTIHKSQGSTLDIAEIDVGDSIFEYGQTYTALSRVKDLKGLKIINFKADKIIANKDVIDFYNNYIDIDENKIQETITNLYKKYKEDKKNKKKLNESCNNKVEIINYKDIIDNKNNDSEVNKDNSEKDELDYDNEDYNENNLEEIGL